MACRSGSAFFDKTLECRSVRRRDGRPRGDGNVSARRDPTTGPAMSSFRAATVIWTSIRWMIPVCVQLRIGVNMLGDSDGDLPPVHALTSRGIVRNLVSYNIFGNSGGEQSRLGPDQGSGARRCGSGRRLGSDRRIFCA